LPPVFTSIPTGVEVPGILAVLAEDLTLRAQGPIASLLLLPFSSVFSSIHAECRFSGCLDEMFPITPNADLMSSVRQALLHFIWRNIHPRTHSFSGLHRIQREVLITTQKFSNNSS
jgi:hypothetical protein